MKSLGVIKLNQKAMLPLQRNNDFVIFSLEHKFIKPHSYEAIRTGLCIRIPNKHKGLILPCHEYNRTKGLFTTGSISSYHRGELIVTLYNFQDIPHRVDEGDMIAVLNVVPIIIPEIRMSNDSFNDISD